MAWTSSRTAGGSRPPQVAQEDQGDRYQPDEPRRGERAEVLHRLAADHEEEAAEAVLAHPIEEPTDVGLLRARTQHVDDADEEPARHEDHGEQEQGPGAHPPAQEQPGQEREPRRSRERGAEVATPGRSRHHQQGDRQHADGEQHGAPAGPSPHEQSGKEDHRRGQLREREVPLPRHPDPDGGRVPEHGVELEARAGDEVDDVQDDDEPERGDERAGRMPSPDGETGAADQRGGDEEERPVRQDIVVLAEVQPAGQVGGVEEPQHRERAPLHRAPPGPPAHQHESRSRARAAPRGRAPRCRRR